VLFDRVMHPPAMYHVTRGWRLWGISQLHFKTPYDNNLPFLLLPPSPTPPSSTRGRRSRTREPPQHTRPFQQPATRPNRANNIRLLRPRWGLVRFYLKGFFYLEPL
jgi:hypothetical protein